MAQSFVEAADRKRRIEDVGDECLRELISRSFLESMPMDESQVTMHDLMHDLAQGVSGDFLAIHDIKTPSKSLHRARHFSYLSGFYDPITKFQAIAETKYLRSFLRLSDTRNFVSHLTKAAILKPSFSCLRVLSIPKYGDPKLLEVIGCPKHLCYLDISFSAIKHLPEWLTTLCNLQTLILSNCGCLERLPDDMWRLVSLRHLDIEGTTLLSHMPKQISKLNTLQTLTDFIVGKDIGSAGIQDLRELPHIRGRLAIRKLQNVDSPNDAYLVDLSNRDYIDDLELEFESQENNDSEKERKVLQNLKPPSNVERLTVRDYAGTRFPKWLDPGCVHYMKMTSLCLSGCRYCFNLPPLGQLSCLEELKIEGMDLIIKVGHEFYGHGIRDIFPALKSLIFKKMKCWEVWSNVDAEGTAICFPRLEKLSLLNCPNLKGNLPVHVPSLVELEIDGCVQLSRVLPEVSQVATCPRAELGRAFNVTLITTLRLKGLMQLVNLPPILEMLLSLNSLTIKRCDNLKSLANVKLPSKLISLKIEKCKVLESLPGGLVSLAHLQELELSKCGSLVWYSGSNLPTSLRLISVSECEKWEFPIIKERMQCYTSLEHLSLTHTSSHLVSFPLGIFPNLRFLELMYCKGLERVYIQRDIEERENSLSTLSWLTIAECPKLEMVGKETGIREVTVLPAPNLDILNIWSCEKLKPVVMEMEGQVFLPKLIELEISKQNKVIPEWPLNPWRSLFRFSCLTHLTMKDVEVECLHESWVRLPTSLLYLRIKDCPELRRVDWKALQTLTSLVGLFIEECPKLEGLPEEGFAPSLGCLHIMGCPMVEERCQPEKGKDWSKIRDIPYVTINDRYIWET